MGSFRRSSSCKVFPKSAHLYGRLFTFSQYVLGLCNFALILPLLLPGSTNAQSFNSKEDNVPSAKRWIFNGNPKKVQGIGIANYSQFNPAKSWDEAFEYALQDLNANHSLLIYHFGYQIGRSPLHTRSNDAIRNFLASTQVAIVDSVRWEGQAFLLVEPKSQIPDSLIYPERDFKPVEDSLTKHSANASSTNQWIRTSGSAARINSNWNISITKAKQNALRNLAEDLAIQVRIETYSQNNVQRRYYNFSTCLCLPTH